MKVFSELAQLKSILIGEPVNYLLTQLYQNLGVILRRENARAVVKRASSQASVSDAVLAAAVTLQSQAAESD